MLNIIKHGKDYNKINHDGINFLVARNINDVKKEDMETIDAVVIDTLNEGQIESIIYYIRKNKQLSVSLMPVYQNSDGEDTKIHIQSDGGVDLLHIPSLAQKVMRIKKRINRLPSTVKLNGYDYMVMYKTMAYLYTRNLSLAPRTGRNSLIGYTFPFLSIFYKDEETESLLKNLQNAVEKNYLTVKLIDKIHTCRSCQGSYLNYRETCPGCKSINLKTSDIIHHFLCANVAPEQDYRKEGHLECPKCNKTLRHIGIDYDKPSSVYGCNDCTHQFQTPEMGVLCLDCHTENGLHELSEKVIGEYNLTEQGEHLLFQTGIDADETKEHVSSYGSISVELFWLIVKQEIYRVNLKNVNSVVGKISFDDLRLSQFNKKMKESLKQEIGSIIKSYLLPSDILAVHDYNSYYFLLPETTAKEHVERLEIIAYNLNKLLRDNLDNEEKKIVDVSHRQLLPDTDIKDIENDLQHTQPVT